ncbi:MAG: LPS translocon maturation chaperone LptM [Gammaproteobacteria bacterium]
MKYVYIIFFLANIVFLTGCGQKGPLYLPSSPAPETIAT